ncbi:MAG: purine-nucleoside phosphorylase [Gemmatimonadaceae bacterium]
MTADTAPTPVEESARVVRSRIGRREPAIALILGSGLGALARAIEDPVELAFAEIPGFPAAAVAGHSGRLVAGTLEGHDVLAFAGRFHFYEGHPPHVVVLPVRLSHALGARTLFVSNAAGGIRRTLRPGDLMIIADHIDLMCRNPLIGPVRAGESRFPDMSAPYDAELLAEMRMAALEVGVASPEGVYAGVLGPSYETSAEVRLLELLGADAVGMSTVPEVIVARALGMRVVGVSCITNVATGLTAAPVSHADVLSTSARSAERLERLVRAFLSRLRH